MKDYYNIDLEINDKIIFRSMPFESEDEFIDVAHDCANALALNGIKRDECAMIYLYVNEEYEKSGAFFVKQSFCGNVCEIIATVYRDCGLFVEWL